MDWLNSLISIPSAIQAVVVLSLICATGLALGKLRFMGISLGVAFVFFIGILAGHFGLHINHDVLMYAETFGLVLFVYALGLHVGPNFFGSLRHEGLPMNMWGIALIVLGTAMALCLCIFLPVSISDMVGLLCGATTNTPALGAAQQALDQLGKSTGTIALGCAVTYPLGVVGVILAMVLLRKLFVKPADLERKFDTDEGNAFIGEYIVINPAVEGKTITQVSQMSHCTYVVTRLWRGDKVIVPESTTILKKGDNILLITRKEEADAMSLLFGEKVERDWNKDNVDWNKIDSNVESRVIVLTKAVLNGKRLGNLHLRHTYGVNVSRIIRGDIKLFATYDLRLRYGDQLVVVGKHDDVDHVERFLGNTIKSLNEPNIGSIFLGIVLGLALGAISFKVPGLSAPVHLGIAGGPVIIGIIVGSLSPRLHFISYTTQSASLMLRKLGLSLYLACLGLDAGGQFFETIFRPEGIMWVAIGFFITLVPTVIIGLIALKTKTMDFGTICGILCGSMANPMALTYANDTIEGDTPSISYASVYPIDMFLRVVIAQAIIMFFV